MAFEATNSINDVPNNFEDVQGRKDKQFWLKTMEKALESIDKNNTWEVASKPNGVKILDTKWVYSKKPLEENEYDKYKARLVVRGFAQEDIDVDDILFLFYNIAL